MLRASRIQAPAPFGILAAFLVPAGTGPMLFAQPVAAAPSQAAVPPLRTRQLTSLTGWEISEYLKRNDVIFIPVGPTEQNGGNPVDVEYVIPLAYATRLAEKSDGLVLPYLAYFYPGSTTTSPATVSVSPSEGLAYLKVITRSLIRQGFRRIVFMTAHGPSSATMLPLVREIFDETHVPVLWLDSMCVMRAGPASAPPAAPSAGDMQNRFRLMTFGAYKTVGRLDDLPTGLAQPQHSLPTQNPLAGMMKVLGSSTAGKPLGDFYADPVQHGGWVRPVSAAEREKWGNEGAAMIADQVRKFDISTVLQSMRDLSAFTRQLEVKHGQLLPGTPAK